MGTQNENLPENSVVKIELQDSDSESVLESDWHDSDTESDSDNDKQLTLTTDGAVGIPLPKQDQLRPTFGNIAVQNSTDVHFGNKTFYHGPVTIKQFYGAPTPGALEGPGGAEKINKGYVDDFCDVTYSGDNVNNNKNKTVINGGVENGNGGGNMEDNDNGICTKGLKWFQKTRDIRMKSIIAACAIVVVATVILVTVLVMRPSGDIGTANQSNPKEDDFPNIPIKTSIGASLLSDGDTLRFVSRQQWLAQPPEYPATPLELPADKVIITHTATEGCSDQASCTFHVRYIQTYHIESNHWWDIGYNFLVGGDGAVYEGRGWDAEGAHTKGYNKKSISIAFIGTFNNIVPPERQVKAALKLIEEGEKKNKLTKDYKIFGHRQLIPSLSPGDKLYNIIQKWPHWSSSIS